MTSYHEDDILKTSVFLKICWRGPQLHFWGGGGPNCLCPAFFGCRPSLQNFASIFFLWKTVM